MADVFLIKTSNGSLIPADEDSAEAIRKQKIGQGFVVNLKKVRNIRFHRKFFALLNYAFDTWEPEGKTYKGQPVSKNFDQFRKDITILAGFYETAIRLDGTVRVTAKSISFANMDEIEFEQLYSKVIDVLLSRVFIGQTRADIDVVVNNLLAYI